MKWCHSTWLLVGSLLLAGCLSPTLPLPPPDEPQSMTSVSDGVWGIAGTCVPGARVIVFNEVTREGSVVEANRSGHYYVELKANLCDLASVSQSTDDEDSAETGFVVHPRVEGQPDQPSACTP